MKGSHDNWLLAVFSTKNPLARLLKLIDDKPQMPPECNYDIMDGLHNICKQALQNDRLRREDVEKLSIVLRTVSLLANYEEGPKGLAQLLDKGLTNMMNILVATLRCENDRADSGIDQFLEDILEVIGAVSDYSTKAKSYVVETFCNTLLQIVISVFVRFITKMETLKTINIILEGCPLYAREKMKASPVHKELIQRLCSQIYSIGDYEFQVGIIEALFRLSNRADRETFARGCFTNKDSLEAFFQIRDSDFETDCRRFLNILNERNTQKFRVISIPCRKACLGDYELVKPADTNYLEFWVDFNTGSKRISLFCNPETPLSQDDDEGMWETVSIWHDNLLGYTRKDLGSKTETKFELRGKARDLIGFGPQFSDCTVSLQFDTRADVKTALELTFCPTVAQVKASRKISQSIDTLSSAAREHTTERLEKIATAAVTLARRPHVSVPCQPMNRLLHQDQSAKPSCHDINGPPLNEKSPKPPRTPTGRGTRGVKRVKTPLQLVSSSAKSDDTAHSVAESSTGGSQTNRKVSVGIRHTEPDRSGGDQCQVQCDNDSKPEETEVVIPSSVPDEPASVCVIEDSQPPAKDLQKPLVDAAKKKEKCKLENSVNCSSETKVPVSVPRVMTLRSSPKDHYEVEAVVSACDIYVKDTLRASMPPVLSTVSEESTTPCVSDKSAKMATESGSVEHDKARTMKEMLASKGQVVGRITMMSPDSTSQSTAVAPYHPTDGAGAKKRKMKRRKKSRGTKARKAAATRRKLPSRGGSVSSQDASSGAELESLLEEETETANVSDDDFKPEAKPLSRKDARDKTEAPINQRLRRRGKVADNILQDQKDSSCKNNKEAGKGDSCRLDHRKTQHMNQATDKEQSRTVSKRLMEKRKAQQQDKEIAAKKPQKGRKKSQGDKALNNHIEKEGKPLSPCLPSDIKATEESVCCISQEVRSCHDEDLEKAKATDVETTATQEMFGSQIDDYETESQDINLIHRDDFEDNVESQESKACDDHNEVEQSKPSKAETEKGSFRDKKKELKALQVTNPAKKMVDPYGFEDHTKMEYKLDPYGFGDHGEDGCTAPKKMVDPYGFEDHAEFGDSIHKKKIGGKQAKKMALQNPDYPDKRRSKDGLLRGAKKLLKIRNDNSFVHETSVTHVKSPKFFKSRHKEQTKFQTMFNNSSDDIYSFEPDTDAADISKKNRNTQKKPERKGDHTATDDELLSDSQGQDKLSRSFPETSFSTRQNKPRPKKNLLKETKVKQEPEHSAVPRTKHCRSTAVDMEKVNEKPKYKLKCLSTLREKFQTSALYDFEEAIATNFGFDADDNGKTVTTAPSEDHNKKETNKQFGKGKHASFEDNLKSKARGNNDTMNNCLQRKSKARETSETVTNHLQRTKDESKKTEKQIETYKPKKTQKENKADAYNPNKTQKENKVDAYNPKKTQKEKEVDAYNPKKPQKENKVDAYNPKKMQKENKVDAYKPKKTQKEKEADAYKPKKTQREKEADAYKPILMNHGGDTTDVDKLTCGDMPDFGQLCRGLIEASEYNFRSVNRRPSKRVNYRDISDSEIDTTPSVGVVSECTSTACKQSARRKHTEPEVKPPVRKKHKKSVFSETDEGAETRSEVSWLGSTARRGKPKPARTYRNRTGKVPVHTTTASDSEGIQSDQDEPVQVIHKKKDMRKKRKVESPRLTEGEDSETEQLYFRLKNKKCAADKENDPTALTKHRKCTPKRKDFAASFKSSLQRFDTPKVMTPVTPKTPTSSKGSFRGSRYQALNVQINKTPVTPGSRLDISVEEFRFENLELTPHVALDSPIMLQRDDADEINLAESADENMEVLTQVFSVRGCSTPRSHKSLGSKSMMSALDKRESDLAEALEVMTSGPYKKSLGRPARHKRQIQYACYNEEEEGGKVDGVEDEPEEVYGEEDKGKTLSPLEVSIRPRKLFHDSVTAERTLVHAKDVMPEEKLDEEDEDEMEEEGTTSVSEMGTSLPGDLDIGMNIASLGKSFGAELQRNLLARKQSVEQLTRHALKVTQKQVSSFWSQQHMSRKHLLSEFRESLLQEVYSLEADCSRCTEAEDKVLACIKQEQKVIDGCKRSQGKRLQNLYTMRDEFMRTMRKLDTAERRQLGTIRETMKEEMQTLQKKLLQQSQQQEMNQVKRAMQTLFM